jgi:hypothetical protein
METGIPYIPVIIIIYSLIRHLAKCRQRNYCHKTRQGYKSRWAATFIPRHTVKGGPMGENAIYETSRVCRPKAVLERT